MKSETTNFKQKVHISSFLKLRTSLDGAQDRSSVKEATVTDAVDSSRIVAEVSQEESKLKLISDDIPSSLLTNQQQTAQKDLQEFLGKRRVEFDTSILPTALIQPAANLQNLRLEQLAHTIAIPYPRVVSSMRPITIGPSSSTPYMRDQPFTTQTSAFVHPDASRLSPKPRTIPTISIAGAGTQSNLKIQPIVLSSDQQSQYIIPKISQTSVSDPQITVTQKLQQSDTGILQRISQSLPFMSIPQPEALQLSQPKQFTLSALPNRPSTQQVMNYFAQRSSHLIVPESLKTHATNHENSTQSQQTSHQPHQKALISNQTSHQSDQKHLDGATYFRFEEHLERLCKQLCTLVRRPVGKVCSLSQREAVYSAVMRLIENFQLVPVNAEMLVKKKVGRYFGLLHSLLRDINDQQSDLYSKLFMETDLLLKQLRSLAMKFVDAQVLLSTKSARRTHFRLPTRSGAIPKTQ